tara:strand:- start:376 stop:1023 length:648 start_codon:yes stop_codon:yes gene_type:complete
MKWINMSDEILDMLNPYTDWFFKQDLEWLNELAKQNEKNTNTIEHSCSDIYLKEIVDKDGRHEGFPEVSYSYDLQRGGLPGEFKEKHDALQEELLMFLGARNQAVHVYYPKEGFMGWHNNWNAHGYNILLSYTKNGGGFFKYRDPATHDVVEMLDTPGWSAKVGYYGRGREPDKVYYHCAGTYEPRLTLGFVVPNLDIWRSMIEDISGEDASHFS